MTEQPDLSTLPQRMRYAADVLREANVRYGEEWVWTIWALEHFSLKWEKEDCAAAEHDALVEELAQELHALAGGCRGTFDGPACERSTFRDNARKLIESGWRKSEQP